MRVKARFNNDITLVRLLAEHPMETGSRHHTETGEIIPAKYIQELTCEYQGKVVFLAHFGTSMSENPFISFSFHGGEKGHTLQLRWNDNTGDIKKVEATIR